MNRDGNVNVKARSFLSELRCIGVELDLNISFIQIFFYSDFIPSKCKIVFDVPQSQKKM